MFKKKFKVRIKSYSGQLYRIQWANYRIFPKWRTLKRYGLSFWVPALNSYSVSKSLAQKLCTLDDIRVYEEAQQRIADKHPLVENIV